MSSSPIYDTWAAIPLKFDKNCCPLQQKYRWVLAKAGTSRVLTLVAKDDLTEEDNKHADLRDIFDYMIKQIKICSAPQNSSEIQSLIGYRYQVVKKYEDYWKPRCILNRLLDLFLNLFGSSWSLTTRYKQLMHQIDLRLAANSAHRAIQAGINETQAILKAVDKCFLQWKAHDDYKSLVSQKRNHTFIQIGLNSNGRRYILASEDRPINGLAESEQFLEVVRKSCKDFLITQQNLLYPNAKIEVEIFAVGKNTSTAFFKCLHVFTYEIQSGHTKMNGASVKHLSKQGLTANNLDMILKPKFITIPSAFQFV